MNHSPTKSHEFAYAVGETVEVTLRGIVVERTNSENGDKYWIEQTLPDGRSARQWFKERDVYEPDDDGVGNQRVVA